MKVEIYTDGSSRGNPGPGGWGGVCLVVSDNNHTVKEYGGREHDTTNNRMEMMAVIEGFKLVLSSQFSVLRNQNAHDVTVTVCADSEYVIKGATSWMTSWKKNGWKTSQKKPVLNQDLWEMIDEMMMALENNNVHLAWKHVRGHSNILLNERADAIATSFADNDPVKLYDGPHAHYVATISESNN